MVGHGDDPNNQVPIAFVVGEESLTTAQVKTALRSISELPECDVVFVDAIPKSPAGKILRADLLKGMVPAPINSN